MKKYGRIILSALISLLVLCTGLVSELSLVYAIGFQAEEIYDSVFVIYSGASLGSGFAVGSNCIVTNEHVISNRGNIMIADYSGNQKEAYMIASDEMLDIAVLGVEDAVFKPLAAADLSKISTGDAAYAIGAPNSMAYTLTGGIISAKERVIGTQSYIQTDAAINSGNSGGPLLDDSGNVLGVNTLKISDSEGIGLAVPISRVQEFLEAQGIALLENGTVNGEVNPQPAENRSDIGQNEGSEKNAASGWIEKNRAKIMVLTVCLVLSMSLNIILIIYLVFQKRKSIIKEYDPSERTDFDIDLLE